MFVAVDVGNTGAKAGAFRGDDLVSVARIPPDATDLPGLLGVDPDAIRATVAVSVSEPALARFLAGAGSGAKVLGVDVPLLVPNRYHDPAEVGRDRLVNAAAGHALAGGAAVVVDLGSAVTVDAVDSGGAFLGGAIAPGLPAFRAGLREAAPGLPPIPGGEPSDEVPRSTADALRTGAVRGLAGLAERLVAEARAWLSDAGGSVPVLLTGGDAALVARHVSVPARVCPDLTLRGVAILWRRANAEGA